MPGAAAGALIRAPVVVVAYSGGYLSAAYALERGGAAHRTKGLILIYVPFVLLGYLFAQSAFISHLRGNAVLLSESQFPELHAQFQDCCRKLEMEPPEAYERLLLDCLLGDNTLFTRADEVEASWAWISRPIFSSTPATSSSPSGPPSSGRSSPSTRVSRTTAR